jgi:hypothetical protein
MGNGAYCCSSEKDICKTRWSQRPFTADEQKSYNAVLEIYDKIYEHCKKVEKGEIPDKTPLKIDVPSQYNLQFKKIMKFIWDGDYIKDTGEFVYTKYVKGRYRDGGSGPHMPQMPPDNDFKLKL